MSEQSDNDQQVETDVQESDPSGNGPQGLTGDMGISSERTGPSGTAPAADGVQGTGSHGSATEGTYGVSNTARADAHDTVTERDGAGEESNPAEVPSHEFEPDKNPGHSGG
jgi:hypothetical protein